MVLSFQLHFICVFWTVVVSLAVSPSCVLVSPHQPDRLLHICLISPAQHFEEYRIRTFMEMAKSEIKKEL